SDILFCSVASKPSAQPYFLADQLADRNPGSKRERCAIDSRTYWSSYLRQTAILREELIALAVSILRSARRVHNRDYAGLTRFRFGPFPFLLPLAPGTPFAA